MLPFWLIGTLIVFPLTWLLLNDLIWKAGYGELLTERPLAAVHHRIMGTMQELDNAGEDVAYYEGHLRGYPEATAASKAQWQQALDHARHQQRIILLKSTLVALATYIPIGLILDRWHQRGRMTNELAAI